MTVQPVPARGGGESRFWPGPALMTFRPRPKGRSLTRGPLYAVQVPSAPHESPFPIRLDVERLQPHGPDDLRRAVHQHADEDGQAEGPGIERGGVLELPEYDDQNHDLNAIGDDRGPHHRLHANPREAAHDEHAEPEERRDHGHADRGADEPLAAAEHGTEHRHD